jgi:hypothetical protein
MSKSPDGLYMRFNSYLSALEELKPQDYIIGAGPSIEPNLDAHNYYIYELATKGFLGLASILVILFGALSFLFNQFRKSNDIPSKQIFGGALLALFAVCICSQAGEYLMWNRPTALLVTTLGLSYSFYLCEKRSIVKGAK